MRMLTLLCSVLAASFLGAPVYAQNAKRVSSAIPRGVDGKPDFTGVWQPGSTTPGTWEEANSGAGLGGTGVNPTAPSAPSASARQGGGAPYKPEAAKKVLESFNNRGIDDPAALCLPPGVPRIVAVGLFPIQIVQTPQQLAFMYEWMNIFRAVPLNAKHPDDLEPSYMGDSVGHWEGDTLVVDVTGFNDKTWLIGTGTFHTEALHVTERYTHVNAERIDLEVTMEDPNVLTKPWIYRTSMMLRRGTRLREYACTENNLDPERYEKLIQDNINFRRN
ncbi:MAG TPA: hypothetical protein VN841_24335 [Bryobacteraceae bacterium]|nr:hypothetical protein [Bryobacteraceae bacterium]